MPSRRSLRQHVALALLVALVEGCSTSAAIERRTGPTIVGRIDHADVNRLYVTGDDFGHYSIERSDIVEIDHPGKIGSVAGGITTGVGLGFLMLARFAPDCTHRDPSQGPDCWNLSALSTLIGVGYLLVGLPVLLRNAIVLSRSEAAARSAHSPTPSEAR